MAHPLISIIIPTYNRGYLINETLDSILVQTYENWECIIVDDGSTDNTNKIVAEYIKKDSRFKYHQRPEERKKGANTCRNYGFELSRGQYINWFDSDDIMLKDKLKIQYEGLVNSKFNFSVCQTLVFEKNVSNVLGLRHQKIISDNSLLDFVNHDIAFLTQAPLFKVKFLKDKGLKFDENLHAAQEWEFICRLLYYSPDYHTEKKPLVLIRRHQNSITYRDNAEFREWNYYLAREKVFTFLKHKNNLNSKIKIISSLEQYFKDYFRSILFKKQRRKILRVFFNGIFPFNSLHLNIRLFFILCIILLTGKGYKYRKII